MKGNRTTRIEKELKIVVTEGVCEGGFECNKEWW